MKKYPIEFAKNYAYIIKQAESGCKRSAIKVKQNKQEIEFVQKWNGKEITILELEKYISEFQEVIFDGETITVYNGRVE